MDEGGAREGRFDANGICLYPCNNTDDCFCWLEAPELMEESDG